MATTPAAVPVPTDNRWNATCRQVARRQPWADRPRLALGGARTCGNVHSGNGPQPGSLQHRDSLHGREFGHRSHDDGGDVHGNVSRRRPPRSPARRSRRPRRYRSRRAARCRQPRRARRPFRSRVARQVDLDHNELTTAVIRLEAIRSAEVMTSTYKDIRRISIGQSCAPGAENPTSARLRTPATPAAARWHRRSHDRDTRTDQDLRIHHCRL